jgi:hypothetical protein
MLLFLCVLMHGKDTGKRRLRNKLLCWNFYLNFPLTVYSLNSEHYLVIIVFDLFFFII